MLSENTSDNNCSDDFPYTDEYYRELSDDVTFLVMSSLCALISCVLIGGLLEHVWYFHRQLAGDDKRCKQIYLLGIYPVIASLSCLSIVVPRSTILTDLLASVCLSAAIYQFVSLTILHYGGAKGMLSTMADETISFRTPPLGCCLCCVKKVRFTRRTLNVLRIMVTQIIIIRPILMLISLVLWTNGQFTPESRLRTVSLYLFISLVWCGIYGERSWNIFVRLATIYMFFTCILDCQEMWNCTLLGCNASSTLLAMYGLIVTFRLSKVRLQEERIRYKFAALQLTFIVVDIQYTIFSILSTYDIPECIGTRSPKIRGSNAHHMLLVVEMLLLGALARFAYRESPTSNNSSDSIRPHVIQNGRTKEELTKVADDTTKVNHYDYFHPYAFTKQSILTDKMYSMRL